MLDHSLCCLRNLIDANGIPNGFLNAYLVLWFDGCDPINSLEGMYFQNMQVTAVNIIK